MEETNKYFRSKNINLRNIWFSQAIKFYNTSNLTGNITNFLIQNWLVSDIRETTIPKTLPILKRTSGQFSANHILQINSIRRIDTSFFSQYITLTEKKIDLSFFYGSNDENQNENQNEKKKSCLNNIDKKDNKRCLMFELFDGENTYFGIENEVIDFFSTSTPPGVKVHIIGMIKFQKNIIFLNKSSIVLIGGEVESLYKSNNSLNILKSELKFVNQPLLTCLKKNESFIFSYKSQKEEAMANKEISQINQIKIDSFSDIEKNNHNEEFLNNKKLSEDFENNVINANNSSFSYLEPLGTPNLSEFIIHPIPKDKINTHTINDSTSINEDVMISTLQQPKQNQSSIQNLLSVSLTKDSENSKKCNLKNESLECKKIVNEQIPCTSNFNHSEDKCLTIFLPENTNKNSFLNTYEKKDISNYDKENILKRQFNDNYDFFNTSIVDIKKMKMQKNEDNLSFEKIVSIQEAIRLASISFAAYHATVKGEVTKIINNLSVEDNQWTMKVAIIDDSKTSLECLLDNVVIQDFLEMTAEEILLLRKTNFTRQKEIAKNRLNCLLERLKLKNLVFNIHIFDSSLITPVIVKIRTFNQFIYKIC
ncbi:Domain of unknown function DUF1767 domain-containing protein [Strongyloides ratti]|uniref:RecQ-mediated genome instability protein 1 n=1 Tax=Strongyloides ratti TaxID=34506 RepID=A0A090L9I6_STRRB|nr:Domain of unknown function DUF1767 domain-containing protein [Strongyloides ratti]CEF66451.1 Domain of unknown function DUF1767 domain-containing protein [Strongyloides ratti]